MKLSPVHKNICVSIRTFFRHWIIEFFNKWLPHPSFHILFVVRIYNKIHYLYNLVFAWFVTLSVFFIISCHYLSNLWFKTHKKV
ncbi:hypothetical protein HanIR_Chr16g0831911 [Helianthus annuus]|nr:hypothetical protein HanIR_Chr16g0831911 [Helianthus annuus]